MPGTFNVAIRILREINMFKIKWENIPDMAFTVRNIEVSPNSEKKVGSKGQGCGSARGLPTGFLRQVGRRVVPTLFCQYRRVNCLFWERPHVPRLLSPRGHHWSSRSMDSSLTVELESCLAVLSAFDGLLTVDGLLTAC